MEEFLKGFHPEDEGETHQQSNGNCKIALVSFAFRNEELIEWLTERGTYIKQQEWDNVQKINDQIQEAISHPNSELLDKL